MKYEIFNLKTKKRMPYTGEYRFKFIAKMILWIILNIIGFGFNKKWTIKEIK